MTGPNRSHFHPAELIAGDALAILNGYSALVMLRPTAKRHYMFFGPIDSKNNLPVQDIKGPRTTFELV